MLDGMSNVFALHQLGIIFIIANYFYRCIMIPLSSDDEFLSGGKKNVASNFQYHLMKEFPK